MITNCKFTSITVKVEFFNKTEIFYTHILCTLVISRQNCGLQCAFLEVSNELISYVSVTSRLESVYNVLSYQRC